jgi:hypothetical protein
VTFAEEAGRARPSARVDTNGHAVGEAVTAATPSRKRATAATRVR